jgi:hypothetical protein
LLPPAFISTANPDRTPMLPTSLVLQIDTATPIARLHGIGSDFVMALWETAPAIKAAWPRRWTMRMNGTVY